MAAKVNLEMTIKCYKNLAAHLESVEHEIAKGTYPESELKELFILIFDEEPKESR